MAVALPIFENFDIHADGNVSTRFDKWIKRLENLFIAADIDDTKRQRALLLHYGGQDLFDIFETLDGTGDDFETLKTKLTTHFEPKKNAEFEIYKFRQFKQNPGESIDEFHTRLRQMSKNCEFTDKDKEIKSQIIQCCSSSRLRRKALKTPKITLTNLLDEARSLEISEVQAQGIESTAINAVQSPKYRDKRVSTRVGERNGSTTVVKRDNKQCFRCGGQWPHNGTCPARNRKCVRCQRYGHFADFCDNFKKSQVKPKYGEPNRNRVNQVDTDQQLESETSSNSDDEYTFTVTNDSSVNSVNSRPELLVTINGKKQKMLIDSGSTANIVNENIAKILDVKVSKCTTNLYAFNAKDPLPVVGKFRAQIKYNGSVTKTDFVVIQGNGCYILGYNAACDLGVLKFVYTLDESKSKTEIIHSQYPKLFSGIGKMKNASVKLHISADIQPVKQTHRHIPFHQRKSVEECLDKLIQNDIIEPSQGATTWINPVVLVPKSSGGVRLCIDMREPNMAISRERHVMPTLDEIIHDLNGCAVYSKIDLKEGYHQLSLHPDSRHITTFSTHKGLYRYKRLSFGINAAAEKFQDVIASAISDIPNTKNISDDIICYGRSPEEHDKALHKLLQRCSDLNLKFVYTLDESKSKTEIIHSQYPKLFSGIGKMKNASVKLHISADIQPVKQTHRHIPFHQRKSVEECMDKLIQNDIIEPSQGATTWINPVVLVPKSSGGVRLCIDMREPNMAISRERHVMPTLDEIIHDLNGCAVYSKIDLKEGYHQLSLHPDSRHITTFSTHKGLYRYKRLSFGINAAAEKFQDVIASAISDIPNTKNISDDIICYGRSPEEHDKALHKLLQRCSDLNLTLNKAKCQFYMSEITFYGWVFSKGGLKPDPAKVKSIFNMKTPTNVSECRSLLGLTNYVSRCIPGYADIVKPIRELTKKDVAFLWSELQEHALNKLKSELVSSDVMAYFDPNKETELVVDASPYGLGGILSQGGRVIAYASKALSPTESKYSQIEREALSLSWGCHHFRMYLLGKHYTIKTDHMPLVTLFNNPKSKASSRIENWRLRLQNFHFTVHYGKGSENPADFMSRYVDNSVCNTSLVSESSEEYVNFVVSSSLPKAMSVDEIAEATKCDIVLQLVMGAISTNRWNMSQKDLDTYDAEVIKSFNGYGKMKDELTSVDGKLILRDHRIVVPKSLQNKIISLAHEGHQGMVKTKMLLRSKVWFPAMDSMCDSVVKQCFQCQVATNIKSREPLKMTELPKRPWDRVSADFAEVSRQYVLVVMDDYSRYPVVEIVHSTSAKAVIPKLDKIFSMFDIPKVLKTDNGPPFNGHEFENFAKHLGFKHRKVTPEWPEGNGEVERFMRTLKKFLHTSNNWKQEIQSFLRIYRGTAHLSTNVPPFNALFGRTMRGKFPDINAYSSVQEFDARTFEQYDRLRKARMKKDADERRNVKENDISVGDEVLVRQTKINKFSTPYSKFPMTVTSTNHSMVTAENDIKRMTRNSSFFKKIVPGTDIKNSGLIYDDASHESVEENLNTPSTHEANEPNETISARDSQKVVLRKSSRKVEKPSRLIEEI